jgi:F-type H+-transporting ATPase subunit b
MRKGMRGLAALGVLLVLAPRAWTQEPAQGAGEAIDGGSTAQAENTHIGDAHAVSGEHGAGAEKPALLNFDPGAAVWSIIIFVVLLVALRAFAWKPILKVLQDREELIQSSLDDAKRERQEAEQLLTEYRQQLARAREEATAIVEEGRRKAEQVGRELQDEARREAAEMFERTRREIDLATDAAIRRLYDQTAELAVDVATGVVRKELSAEDHRALVNDSLERMRAEGTRLN